MPVSLKLHHDGVSGMRGKLDQKLQKHADYQKNCPFSESFDASHRMKMSKDDVNYGRPEEGSKSAARAKAAQLNVSMEIRYLCDMIYDCSEHKDDQEGRAAISFGKLFKLYMRVSDKLVGTLLRARKHGYVHFEGEMLFQRRDDHKMIELARSINTIRAKFGQKPLVSGGGPVEPWEQPEEEEGSGPNASMTRRNSNPTERKTSYVPPTLDDAFLLKIPNLCSRSQSLSDLGCIMFLSEAAKEEESPETDPPDDDPETGNPSIDSTGTTLDPGDWKSSKSLSTPSLNIRNSRMSVSPARMTPRERSRSRGSSPAPSMGRIEETKEHQQLAHPLHGLVPSNTATDTPVRTNHDLLISTTQLLNKVTLELSGPEATGQDGNDCLTIAVPTLPILNLPSILIEGVPESS